MSTAVNKDKSPFQTLLKIIGTMDSNDNIMGRRSSSSSLHSPMGSPSSDYSSSSLGSQYDRYFIVPSSMWWANVLIGRSAKCPCNFMQEKHRRCKMQNFTNPLVLSRSDLATPLKTTKDNLASVFIDSGYAGEQPSSGGDRSIPFSKWVDVLGPHVLNNNLTWTLLPGASFPQELIGLEGRGPTKPRGPCTLKRT